MRRNTALAMGLAVTSGVAALGFAFAGPASAAPVNRTPDFIYTLQANNAKGYPAGSATSPSNGINGDLGPAYNSASAWGAGCVEDDSANGQSSYTFSGTGKLVIKYSTYFFVWDNATPGTYGTGPNVWGGTTYMGISHVIQCSTTDPSSSASASTSDSATSSASASTSDSATSSAAASTSDSSSASESATATLPDTGGSPSDTSVSASDTAVAIPNTGGSLPHTGATGVSLLSALGLGLLALGLFAFATGRRQRSH